MGETWRDQVADDWAEVLSPHASTLASLGVFLREENAAGRGYLPASDRILRAFEHAEAATDDAARRAWLTFAIVGGGPTGVEMNVRF